MTPDEAQEAKTTRISCYLNIAQCYLEGADALHSSGGNGCVEPFYKKAITSCEVALELDPEDMEALFWHSLCWERLGGFGRALEMSFQDWKW